MFVILQPDRNCIRALNTQKMRTLLVIVAVVFFSSCGKDYLYEQKFDVPNNVWNADQKVKFEVNIADAKSVYNLYIRVDNTEFYPKSNLWLFTKSVAPDNSMQIDTVEIFLANTNQWLGQEKEEGVWTGLYPFKLGVGFPSSGKYHFELEQGMRLTKLEDIQAIGLVVEKVN